MKNAVIIVLLLVVAVGGTWVFRQNQSDTSSAAAVGTVEQRPTTGTVDLRQIKLNVTLAGEISPAEQVSVRPEVNGRISDLPVDIGDRVKEGDMLFTLDDKELRIEIESRQTAIEAAELQLQKALRDYERNQELFASELVSKEILDDSQTTYELAENSIERARKELALAEDRLSKTRITAPFDCTILTRPVSAGQAVSGSGGFNSGTEVLTIANLNEMIINAHVNQVDVTRLSADQQVEVIVEAVAGLKVAGRVERIAPQATILNGTKGFSVRILLVNVDPRIQPGMTANISIPVTSADQVLSVPLAAVFTEFNEELQTMERFVYLPKGDKFERRLISIGVSDYFNVEVTSGLEKGEVVSIEQPPTEKIIKTSLAGDGAGGRLTGNGANT